MKKFNTIQNHVCMNAAAVIKLQKYNFMFQQFAKSKLHYGLMHLWI